MGALAEATIPAHLRWIPKGMELEYLAMSDSHAARHAPTPTRPTGSSRARSRCGCRPRATDGTVVVRGVIRLHVSERKRAEAVTTPA